MDKKKIIPYSNVIPMVYAYTTPEVPRHNGWTKIGYTATQTVEKRIWQQTHTADIKAQIEWKREARYTDGTGEYFTDHDFHDYLERKKVERQPQTEWFHIAPKPALQDFNQFAGRDYSDLQKSQGGVQYVLRKEQQEAVQQTLDYLHYTETEEGKGAHREFLWNAKPRFGKTLTTYDFARKMGAKTVLIVTNRPSIANSWYDDFEKFIGWQTGYKFISESDALKGKPVLSRKEFEDMLQQMPDSELDKVGMIAFESLQDLKGAICFGGKFDKLEWIQGQKWDLLVIDEAHEGVDTWKTDRAFDRIQRRFTLHLSGTPFKAIANGKFNTDQIFNWSYEDEQRAKDAWNPVLDETNPYENMPRLNMFTYQLSPMISGEIRKGLDLDNGEHAEFAFDLNEFFRTERGKFVHEKEVKKFLDALTTNEKYPFSTPELRQELAHTFWLLHRVDSAKAMAKLLHEHPVFKDYEVIVAAGDGKLDEAEEQQEEQEDNAASQKSYDRVIQAIRENDKTITLSVGQLTTGVTVKPWTAVLMLSNMKSPAEYMQAAFRAQNAYEYTGHDGKRYRKENAYVFDFAPERTLIIFDEFANNLNSETANGHGTREQREDHIKRLLNFFPVIGEDKEGKMVELDATQVLTIPKSIKAQEVIHRGFMSNFLFQNIGNVFGAPAAVQAILEQLEPVAEPGKKKDTKTLDDAENVPVDAQGNPDISQETVINQTDVLFGPKIYDEVTQSTDEVLQDAQKHVAEDSVVNTIPEKMAATVTSHLEDTVMHQVKDAYHLTNNQAQQVLNRAEKETKQRFQKIVDNHQIDRNQAKATYQKQLDQAETPEEKKQADDSFKETMDQINTKLIQDLQQETKEVIKDNTKNIVQHQEERKAKQEAAKIEDDVRAHLRGFARTIPSFIMAYSEQKGTGGGRNLRLANFTDYTPDDVFKEVTNITEDEFKFLRDGGDYPDPETGETKHFEGHVFDEVVFDESIQEFLNLKEKLNNYFDDKNEEDIFDYIPPQRTNQIFTPKNVVVKMVDALEQENPDVFDDPNRTFADLYMKSGLYITEIVKRLFRNAKLKKLYPDDQTRLKHILEHQVFGFAPSQIIYDIAIAYIFGFDKSANGISHDNFVMADTTPYAKDGKLDELIQEKFGERV